MKPDDRDWTYWLGWYVAYAILAVVVIAAVWNGQFDNLCTKSRPAWLPWAQPEEHCLREWLSALSGWVGFGAAAVGAYFVYHQLAEQRRQTGFMLGDGDPIFQVRTYAFDHKRTVFRLINWNRRTLSLARIIISCPTVTIPQPTKIRCSDKGFQKRATTFTSEIDAKGWLNPIPGVEGWIDRQGPPDILDFEFHFHKGREDFKEILYGLSKSVIVEIVVYGQFEDGTDNEHVFRFKMPVIDFLPNTGERFEIGSTP
ncbi:hypothetical protein J2W42_002224 [Rhizobium tibeticum]|uniref:hypothetical protein n=1 Tax=Rhizobium tibeticum TaxID=501024 RepID=UPI0027867969|nr:hypothetical protein [Rhizobium tibeticum]MDP9809376.1 hypothetical protein [Rhizobium tibeticum]